MSIDEKELPNQAVVPGDDIIFNRALSPYQLRLWKNLSPAPRRGFPNFSTAAGKQVEIEIIKNTLRAKLNGYGKVDLKTSGDQCAAGMFLDGNELVETIEEGDIETFNGLMGQYLEQAHNNGNGGPVSHDDEINEKSGWLPGLFVIDEIFKALCSELQVMIDGVNSALPGGNQNELNSFVSIISTGVTGAVGSAANKYLPFINYSTQGEQVPDDQKTYIKLVRTSAEGFITGAIIHINDWAEGTHSSGAAHK